MSLACVQITKSSTNLKRGRIARQFDFCAVCASKSAPAPESRIVTMRMLEEERLGLTRTLVQHVYVRIS